MNRFSILLDAIAGPRCIECETTLESGPGPLCRPCDLRLPRWRRADGCPRCGTTEPVGSSRSPDGGDRAHRGCSGCLAEGSALHVCHALTRYEGPLRRWLPGFKTAKGPFGPSVAIRLAVDHLATELARRVVRDTGSRPDLVVSVPLHPRRRRRRGFNQCDPIALRIARELDRPFAPDALDRMIDTSSQAGLVGRERRLNVRGAFRASVRLPPAASIWLVDDVLTTGSTLDAAADALIEAGAFEVRALTLAATLPPSRPRTRGARRSAPTYHAAPADDRSDR